MLPVIFFITFGIKHTIIVNRMLLYEGDYAGVSSAALPESSRSLHQCLQSFQSVNAFQSPFFLKKKIVTYSTRKVQNRLSGHQRFFVIVFDFHIYNMHRSVEIASSAQKVWKVKVSEHFPKETRLDPYRRTPRRNIALHT